MSQSQFNSPPVSVASVARNLPSSHDIDLPSSAAYILPPLNPSTNPTASLCSKTSAPPSYESSRSSWERYYHPTSIKRDGISSPELRTVTEIITRYQWDLVKKLRKDISSYFGSVYEDIEFLRKDLKRVDHHLCFLDDAVKLDAESSSLKSHIKDVKASNAVFVNEIQNRFEEETKHIYEKIDYLANCCQEWSQSAVAYLPKLEDNENDDINNDYESSRTQSTISSSCFHNESTGPNLRRSEIQSSFSNPNDDKYSISTCTTVDEIPTKSNTRALSPSH